MRLQQEEEAKAAAEAESLRLQQEEEARLAAEAEVLRLQQEEEAKAAAEAEALRLQQEEEARLAAEAEALRLQQEEEDRLAAEAEVLSRLLQEEEAQRLKKEEADRSAADRESSNETEDQVLSVEDTRSLALENAKRKMEEMARLKSEKDDRRQMVQDSLMKVDNGDGVPAGSFDVGSLETEVISGPDNAISNDQSADIITLQQDLQVPLADENEPTIIAERQSITLTDGEISELDALLDAQEQGEPVDEDRLYELELMDRYSLGEDLSQAELDDLDVILQRRERFQRQTKEYNELLDMQEAGESVDQDRLYYLELVVRKRLGEDLSAQEMDDLAYFEADEEQREAQQVSADMDTDWLHQSGTLLTDEPLTLLEEVEEEEFSESDSHIVSGGAGISPVGSNDAGETEEQIRRDAEELDQLLQLKENGEDVDEQRLYELELTHRRRNGEELSKGELEDLQFFVERSKRYDGYTKEYNDLVDKKEAGEDVDDDRLYSLELAVRSRLGESMTDEELDVLYTFEEEEEKKVAESDESQEKYSEHKVSDSLGLESDLVEADEESSEGNDNDILDDDKGDANDLSPTESVDRSFEQNGDGGGPTLAKDDVGSGGTDELIENIETNGADLPMEEQSSQEGAGDVHREDTLLSTPDGQYDDPNGDSRAPDEADTMLLNGASIDDDFVDERSCV